MGRGALLAPNPHASRRPLLRDAERPPQEVPTRAAVDACCSRAGEFAAHATRYEVETIAGDVLWVPTWTWHRVDYLPVRAQPNPSPEPNPSPNPDPGPHAKSTACRARCAHHAARSANARHILACCMLARLRIHRLSPTIPSRAALTSARRCRAQGVAAVSASLFHVRVEQIVSENPLFAALLIPNLMKELVGWKTQ